MMSNILKCLIYLNTIITNPWQVTGFPITGLERAPRSPVASTVAVKAAPKPPIHGARGAWYVRVQGVRIFLRVNILILRVTRGGGGSLRVLLVRVFTITTRNLDSSTWGVINPDHAPAPPS